MQLESRGKLFRANKRHMGINQTHKKVSTLPHREMSILEDETHTRITIGGHPLLTTQRKNRNYVTTEKGIYQDYEYDGWTLQTGSANATARENLREEATISTPMLTKEEYKELFKIIKEETSNHQGHYVIIPTETLREIEDENRHDIILKRGQVKEGGGKKIKVVNEGEQTSHDMTEIAIIKENTIPMLRMEQAQKGRISPKERDNEELTILFKNGIDGTKQEATENIARWARRLKIKKKVKWVGKPTEGRMKKETDKKI